MSNASDFIIENGVLMKYVGAGGNVVIPDGVQRIKGMTYNEDDVSSAFFGRTDIKSVIMPEGLSSIGDCAFYGCKELEDVTVPTTVREVGFNAFWGTKWLENQQQEYVCAGSVLIRYNGNGVKVHIPNGIETLSEKLFSDNTTLKEVALPESLTSLSTYCFSGCSRLESVHLPNSINVIGKGGLADCKKLKKIDIPDSVIEIGVQAFHGCTSLEEAIVPESVGKIGGEAFRRCTKVERVVILGAPELGKDILKQTPAPLVAGKLPIEKIPGNQLKIQAVLGYLLYSDNYAYERATISSIQKYVAKSLSKLVPEMLKNPVILQQLLKMKLANAEQLLDLFADNAEMRAEILQLTNEE